MVYVIKFGLSPYFKDSLENDFYSKTFCFKFHETTINQIKSGMMDLFSIGVNPKIRSQGHIVDHCLLITALLVNLLNIFFLPILKKLAQISFLLHLGMDGPNVNLKFQTLLLQSNLSAEAKTTFLNIGTCLLHIAHNAFRKGVSSLTCNVDQFAEDIHFFFSSCQPLAELIIKAWLVAEYAPKHSTIRWVTLQKVLVRLIEQYDNLKEYFFTFLPTTSSFKANVEKSK